MRALPDNDFPDDVRRWVRTHRFGMLLTAILAMVLWPVVAGAPSEEGSSLLWALVLIAGVHAAAGRTRLTLFLTAIALVGFGGRLATAFGPRFTYQDQIDVGGHAFSAIFLGIVLYVVFAEVVRSTHVDIDAVMGALSVYLLIGFMWANFYAILFAFEPASFRLPPNWQIEQGLVIPEYSFGYYSFVTLTTLGFGDVLPITYRARTLSWLEAVVGVGYMAIVIASLVGQTIADRQQRREY